MDIAIKDIFEQLISIGQGMLLTNHKYLMFCEELTLASH
jgi:hypothetical protein